MGSVCNTWKPTYYFTSMCDGWMSVPSPPHWPSVWQWQWYNLRVIRFCFSCSPTSTDCIFCTMDMCLEIYWSLRWSKSKKYRIEIWTSHGFVVVIGSAWFVAFFFFIEIHYRSFRDCVHHWVWGTQVVNFEDLVWSFVNMCLCDAFAFWFSPKPYINQIWVFD